MSKREMNKSTGDDLTSRQSGNQQGPSKHRRLGNINSSISNQGEDQSVAITKFETIGLTRELRALCTELSQTKTAATELRRMRGEMEKIFDEEERVLEIQAGVKREAMERLEKRLETYYGQATRVPLVTVGVDVPWSNSCVTEKIRTLLSKNSQSFGSLNVTSSAQASNSSKSEKNVIKSQMQLCKRVKIELERCVEYNREPQESVPPNSDVEEVNVQQIPVKSKRTCVNKHEEEQESAKDTMTPQRRVSIEKLQIKDESEDVEQQAVCRRTRSSQRASSSRSQRTTVHNLQATSPMFQQSSKDFEGMDKNSTSGNADESGSEVNVVDASSGDDETPPGDTSKSNNKKRSDLKQQHRSRRIMVGDYDVLLSNAKFFDINFEKQYRFHRTERYICLACSDRKYSRQRMEDHIWLNHHSGGFHCPLCLNALRRRENIVQHMKKSHNDLEL